MQVSTKLRNTIRRSSVALVAGAAIVGTVAVANASAAPVHPHAASHKVAFLLVASDQKHETGIIHGAINGGGPSVSHNQYDVAKLNGGKFRLNHPDKQTTYKFKVNPKTCYASYTLTGKFTISNGTGRFAGYTGKGAYTGSGETILKRTKAGKCNMNAEGIATAFIVRGTGTVAKK